VSAFITDNKLCFDEDLYAFGWIFILRGPGDQTRNKISEPPVPEVAEDVRVAEVYS
jgi:hypothetical protein